MSDEQLKILDELIDLHSTLEHRTWVKNKLLKIKQLENERIREN